jgi:hypothetical protein
MSGEQERQEPPRPGALAAFTAGTLLAAAAPAALTISALLYFAAWVERQHVFTRYGLTGDAITEPFHSTLARGFEPLLIALVLPTVLVGVVAYARHQALRGRPPSELPPGLLRYDRFVRFIAPFYALLTLLFAVGVGGKITGTWKAKSIERALVETCYDHCFVYRTEKDVFVGVPIAQDPQRLALWTFEGVRMVDASKLHLVRRFRQVTAPASPTGSRPERS